MYAQTPWYAFHDEFGMSGQGFYGTLTQCLRSRLTPLTRSFAFGLLPSENIRSLTLKYKYLASVPGLGVGTCARSLGGLGCWDHYRIRKTISCHSVALCKLLCICHECTWVCVYEVSGSIVLSISIYLAFTRSWMTCMCNPPGLPVVIHRVVCA